MRHGFVVPFTSDLEFVEIAQQAEARGWDAVFSWEAVYRHSAWALLAAAAVRTEHIRLGTLLTPVARYRPWDLAQSVATVDRLSGGRVILGAGLGAVNANWLSFEADEGRAVRARRVGSTRGWRSTPVSWGPTAAPPTSTPGSSGPCAR